QIYIVLNQTSGFTVLADVQPDGSFTAKVRAQATDLITIIVRDHNDNETSINIRTLVRRDPVSGNIISRVIGKSGGTVTSSDGVQRIVPSGALLGATELSQERDANAFAL